MLFALVASAACNKPARPQPRTAAVPAKAAEPPPHTPTHTLHIDAPAEVIQGRPADVRVRIEAQSPWHINTEYPARLQLSTVEGATVAAQQLSQSEAARYDDDAIEFIVTFTAHDRTHAHLAGKVDFAACGNATCLPESVAMNIDLNVSCAGRC